MEAQELRKKMNCPFNGKLCINGVREDFTATNEVGQKIWCRFWTHVVGKDPQTDKNLDHFDCALAWMPIVMLEVSQRSMQNTATMSNVANEVHKAGSEINKMARGLHNVAIEFNNLNENIKRLPEPEATIELPPNGNGEGCEN